MKFISVLGPSIEIGVLLARLVKKTLLMDQLAYFPIAEKGAQMRVL